MLFVTSNKNKFQEAKQLIANLAQEALELDEIQSLDSTEIVRHKLRHAYKQLKQPVLVEDTSLEIEELGGMPGPFVKYFLKALGRDGVARIAEGSPARAVCCVGYHDGTKEHVFVGEMKGTLTRPIGEGFGFDIIFIPEGETMRISELGAEYKQQHSHRARALTKLKEHLDGR